MLKEISFYKIVCILAFITVGISNFASASEAPNIAAASDLKFALTEIAEQFKQETGHEVKLSFGSSGNFFQQINQGAPFQMFLSADESFIFQLSDKKLTKDRGELYAIGRVVLFTPHGAKLTADNQFKDLKAALNDGRLKHFAIANPEHAPYGRAAKAALEYAGIWKAIEPKLVLGENASQAMQFAASGASEGGIVPLSLSKAPEIAKLGNFQLISADWHLSEPLRQRMVLLKSAGEIASLFYRYLQQPVARATFVRYGFSLPNEGVQ